MSRKIQKAKYRRSKRQREEEREVVRKSNSHKDRKTEIKTARDGERMRERDKATEGDIGNFSVSFPYDTT
jgi:hypothetical protein